MFDSFLSPRFDPVIFTRVSSMLAQMTLPFAFYFDDVAPFFRVVLWVTFSTSSSLPVLFAMINAYSNSCFFLLTRHLP